LQAKNRVLALGYNAQHYNVSTQTGGYVKDLPLTKQTKRSLRKTWDFIQKYKLYNLPVTIFRTKKDIHVVRGFVMDEMLENYFGHIIAHKMG